LEKIDVQSDLGVLTSYPYNDKVETFVDILRFFSCAASIKKPNACFDVDIIFVI